MLSKKAEMTWEEILGIILGAGAVLLMAYLLFQLLAPGFDMKVETSEAYFDSFVEEIEVAESGGVGSFLMWKSEKKVSYYIVYFGEEFKVKGREREFSFFANNENAVCLCYVEGGESKCVSCVNLYRPIVWVGGDKNWVVGFGEKVEIKLEGGSYEIKV